MDRNCPRREKQREQHVKLGRCEKVRHVPGAVRVWVGRNTKGIEKRGQKEPDSVGSQCQVKGLGLFLLGLGSWGKAFE